MTERFQIFNGDCLEILPTLEPLSIDCTLADIPYGTTACKWDSVIPFEPMWKELKRLNKPKSAICLFGNEPFSSFLRTSNLEMYKYDWIWDKVSGGSIFNAKLKPLNVTENISVFSNGKTSNGNENNMAYYYQMELAKEENIRPANNGSKIGISIYDYRTKQKQAISANDYDIKKRYPKNLIRLSKYTQEANSLNRVHPTQKPVELLRYLIRTYTQENEIVLDFTMGSGTTGVACMLENRRFIGIEKERNYFEIAQKRIESAIEPLFQTA